MEFDASSVNLKTWPLADEAVTIKSEYERIFGAEPENRGGWYHPADWNRTSYVLDRMEPGARVLDVGVGAAQFLNMVAFSSKYDAVVGLDRTRFNKYTELAPVTRYDGSIAELPFEDDSFDTVTCMEVLEHIPDDVFDAGLAELRRVCRSQLLMTVPFREPLPLSKGHMRRFEPDDITATFPDGVYTILDRPKRPWILIEERFGTSDDTSDAARIAALEEQVRRLKSRRVIRVADTAGGYARWFVRTVRDRLGR